MTTIDLMSKSPGKVEKISAESHWITASTFGCDCCSRTAIVPASEPEILYVILLTLQARAARQAREYADLLETYEQGGYLAVSDRLKASGGNNELV